MPVYTHPLDSVQFRRQRAEQVSPVLIAASVVVGASAANQAVAHTYKDHVGNAAIPETILIVPRSGGGLPLLGSTAATSANVFLSNGNAVAVTVDVYAV